LCAAPAESMLEEFMPAHVTEGTSKGHRCAATVARADPITLSEFSRLIIILIDDESVRRGLLATAQGQGRSELERSIPRHEVWVTTIAPIYNDPLHVVPNLPGLESVLSSQTALGDMSVDVNVSPRAKRDGAALRSMHEKTRVLFTRVHANWTKSGNLDTSTDPFFEELIYFLPIRSGGGVQVVTEESRRVAILFVTYQVGTPAEATELVHFSSRAAPEDVGIEESAIAGERAPMTPRRKRKRVHGIDSTKKAASIRVPLTRWHLAWQQ
jgi:hypothetical protein